MIHSFVYNTIVSTAYNKVNKMNRKMAWIARIDQVQKHPGADSLDICSIGGWRVVTKLNQFAQGDLAVYCSIDSWVPDALAPFLSKGKEPRVYQGVAGQRLRTIKLRGQLSQGLLLPIEPTCANIDSELFDGLAVSVPLNIQKWEQTLPACLSGMVKGVFPDQIPRTDQERVQNLTVEILSAATAGMQFELTEKLEGASMTCYMIDGEFGVCSRNLDLKPDVNNTLWAVAQRDHVEAKMRAVDEHWSWAVQGELIGPGIQDNIYRLSKPQFCVFDVYNIQTGQYLDPAARRALIDRMGLTHVPVLCEVKDLGAGNVDELLLWADAPSLLNQQHLREGIVFKQIHGGMTFNAISNKYLLGEKC